MSEPFNLDNFLKATKVIPNENPVVNKTKWDYIVEYIVDIRYPEDPDILTYSYITLVGGMDSDCYFSECVGNATKSDILPTKITGHLNLEDTSKMDVSTPGVYRLVFGVKTGGEKYWTDCGYEYDAWEEYELIAQYMLTEKETEYCFQDLREDDPYNERFQGDEK